jgi:ATP synthase protein I
MRRSVSLWLVLLLVVAVTSAVFLVTSGLNAAVSAWFGGGIAAANLWVLGRCNRREARASDQSAQRILAALYRCAIQRFLIVALLFATGMGLLKLPALALLVGFIAGQTVLFLPGNKELVN